MPLPANADADHSNATSVQSPNVKGTGHRLASLDIVRGAVMVLMAIDHVRVYAGVPPGGPTPSLFFTRWVTHFCAPIFIFLAGTSAYLYQQRAGSRGALSTFLVQRGLWLVLLELTVLRFAWTFNMDYANFTFAGVIWVIGWSMVALAALVALPTAAVATIGCALIVGHNAVAPALYAIESPSWLLRLVYVGGSFPIPGLGWEVAVLYVLVPWVGVMAAGYGFGAIMHWNPERRQRACLALGGGAIALFLLLRATGIYGDPRPWTPEQSVLGFLNTAKYPASFLFLLMTLGPMLLVLPLLEDLDRGGAGGVPLDGARTGGAAARRAIARWLEVFGRVPFFYYVLHIPLIHLVAVLVALVRTPAGVRWLVNNHPMLPPEPPPGYVWSLPLLYLVTAGVVILLYFPCRWFATVKGTTQRWWVRLL